LCKALSMKLSRLFIPLALVFILSACSFSLAADVTPPPGYHSPTAPAEPVAVVGPLYPLVPPNPADGAGIFSEKCAPCHGTTGKGDGPRAAQLPNPVAAIGTAELARQSSPAKWYATVTQGNLERFMPPFNSLTDRQRWDVLAYVYSLSAPDASIAKGSQLFEQNCARCHGAKGQGNGPDAAQLSKPPQDLTDLAFMAEKSAADFFKAISEGTAPDMPGFADKLSEDDRWALTDFVRSLTFSLPSAPLAQSAPATPGSTAITGGTPVLSASSTTVPSNTTVASSTTVPSNTTVSSNTTVPSSTTVASGTQSTTTPGAGTPSVSATTVATQTLGMITGKVVNASGGQVPPDLTVTLHGFDQMQAVITQTATLQPDYTFSFDNVDMTNGRFFMASVDYGGTTYSSDVQTASTGASTVSLPINIYETTTDASGLSVDRLHLFFDSADPQTIRVIELFILSNTGDKTVVPAEKGQSVVTVKLPADATNLQFQDGALGDRYIQIQDGFGDTAPIPPGSGSHQLLFAYDLPYKNKVDLVQQMTLPTNAVVVLVPAGQFSVKGSSMQDAGTRDAQGTQYQMYNGASLAAGDVLRMTVSGSNPSGLLSGNSKNNLIVGLAVFGVALIGVGLWLYFKNRPTVAVDDGPGMQASPAGSTSDNAETIMDAILALDDLYQAGKLPEDAYRQRRAELKGRLKEIAK
jgi:mono/diheme cytochrome c family protein